MERMKVWGLSVVGILSMIFAGCSRDPLKADVEMFCNASTGPNPTLNEIGPYVFEHAQTSDLKQLISRLPRGDMTIMDFAREFQELMKRTGIERCKMLDALLHVPALREQGDVASGSTDIGSAPPPPPSLSQPLSLQNVPPTQLEDSRIAGNKNIFPDEATKTEISRSGKDKIVSTYRLCLSVDGTVARVDQLRSTGFAAYDAKIERELRTWRYRPYMVNAKAVPVCTHVTFIYSQK